MKSEISSKILWIEANPFDGIAIKDEIHCMRKQDLCPFVNTPCALSFVFYSRYKYAHLDILTVNALSALEGVLYCSEKLVRVSAKLRRLPKKKHPDEKTSVQEGILVIIEYIQRRRA
jgi:hypothetical protein